MLIAVFITEMVILHKYFYLLLLLSQLENDDETRNIYRTIKSQLFHSDLVDRMLWGSCVFCYLGAARKAARQKNVAGGGGGGGFYY